MNAWQSAVKHMEIIPAQTTDQLKAIEKLAWEIIPEFYTPYIPEDHCIFFVKKFQTVDAMQQQIADGFEYYLLGDMDIYLGYMGIQILPAKILISKLYLLKNYRGKGAGTIAMNFAVAKAVELKKKLIELEVSRYNRDTITFYEHKGFSIQELITHHYENGYSIQDYRMIKQLNP